MIMCRPDPRPSAVVWHWFEREFEKGQDFPSVSWALGSDWGSHQSFAKTAAQYKAEAYALMERIYGPKPHSSSALSSQQRTQGE